MKLTLRFLLTALLALTVVSARAADPLRVFIRGGVKTHGPNQHDHPRFLEEYKKILAERGMKAEGSMNFPTAAQLENTDVVVIYCADGMKIVGQDRTNFEAFLKRGGGFVVLHDGVVSGDQHEWAKKVQGGAWVWQDRRTKWLEGQVGVYFVDQEHPITRGISNFDWKDEIYYDLDMAPDAKVLATSFHDVKIIAPQLWTYEKTWEGGSTPYRAFVSLPGHEYDSFLTPHYRAILLRGIAWAGKRSNVDEFTRPDELKSLKYPAGGPTPAEKAVTQFDLHPEFNISLVVDENLAEKIMSMDWDPQGRLWVVETPEYPGGRDINRNDAPVRPYWKTAPEKYEVGKKEPRPPKDRISILEDTNKDGIMDKKTVWAEGLELPTSLVFYKDGVIVTQAPDIFWIRDTNQDGKADKTEVLFTGWGTFDTHAVINNLRWGPDGWIYSAVGYTRGKDVRNAAGKNFGDFSAGIFRFRPDGSAIEQVASGGCNTWGCEVAPDGEIIFTTATCGEPICHVVIPEKYLSRGNTGDIKSFLNVIEDNVIYPPFRETRQPYVQIDWVDKWTAAAGACIYDGGAWPAKWAPEDRYSFFMSEATMHIFHHQFLDTAGPTYAGKKEEGRKQTEFLRSKDYWFRPIHSRVGPDGAMYVVDFYNQIAVHNDTRNPPHGARNAAARPDRDHHFTRLYRVQHKEAKKLPAFNLTTKKPADLAAMLEHPNGWVRTTANRLITETQAGPAQSALEKLAKSSANRFGRIQALYALNNIGKLDSDLLVAAAADKTPAVRKAAARIAGEKPVESPEVQKSIQALLKDSDDRVRITALMSLGSYPASKAIAQSVIQAWPTLEGKWLQSAAIGVVAKDPLLHAEALFAANSNPRLGTLLSHIARQIGLKQDAAAAGKLVQLIAQQPAAKDEIKQAALESLAIQLKPNVRPAWTPELANAFKTLLGSSRFGVVGASLPLIARWDTEKSLSAEIKPVISKLAQQLQSANANEDERAQVAANLLGVRALDPSILPAVGKLVGSDARPEFQVRVIQSLGNTGDAEAGKILLAAYPTVTDELREAIFGQLTKRSDWSASLVEALAEKKVDLVMLGPGRVHRLRTHSDGKVAQRMIQVLNDLRGPEVQEKDQLIAQLAPIVEKAGGNLENGKTVFTQNCAACHQYKGQGRALAPDLTGMGAHGPHELLVHIIDPNRHVEPNFVSVSIETKDDLSYDGIIDRQDRNMIALRNATGDFEIQKNNIKSQRVSSLSLMPNGFESLGGEALRDLIAFLSSDDSKYRVLDLTTAFTADSTKGIYNTPESVNETLRFKKFGMVKAGEIPFEIQSPTRSSTGKNLIVLKGQQGHSRTYPQTVEVKAGVKARQLHFLGGVAGWGWPWNSANPRLKELPLVKVIVQYADGQKEEHVLKNAVEFADYVGSGGEFDVPGSKELPDVMRAGQLRWFSRPARANATIEKITLESYNTEVAPTLVAITAELADGSTSSAPAPKPQAQKTGPRVLIVGGNQHHDFKRWFGDADTATLAKVGVNATYTEDMATVEAEVDKVDVLYLSNNQPMTSKKLRESIFNIPNSGRGLFLSHAALWYSWRDWPEYNRDLVSGGSRSHDAFGEFEVTIDDPEHPVTKGLPKTFRITDELYHMQKEAQGPAIKVLATGKNSAGKTYPVIWVTEHAKGRIVCTSLGHDGKAHEHPAWQQFIQNAITWAGSKRS